MEWLIALIRSCNTSPSAQCIMNAPYKSRAQDRDISVYKTAASRSHVCPALLDLDEKCGAAVQAGVDNA